MDYLARELIDKRRDNISQQLNTLVQEGRLEAEREGRFIKRLRLARFHSIEAIKNGSGSQTERMLHYLFGLADEKGVIRGEVTDIKHLQKSLGFRDFHDVNKALHNLNKVGILEIREARIAGGTNHRITRMRLRMERQKSWPIDMLSDEELPGKVEIEEDIEPLDIVEDRTAEQLAADGDGLTERTETVPLGVEEMETLAEGTVPGVQGTDPIEEAVQSADDEQAALVAPIAESVSNTIEDFEQSFPLISERVGIYRKRVRAKVALTEAGETELADLLSEKLNDPLDKELQKLMVAAGYYG